MRRTVGTDQPGAVDREADREMLDRDVVDNLVVSTLQEGAVDRAERAQAFGRHTGGERHGVLLGDPDVEQTVGEAAGKPVQPGAGGHGGRDRDDLVVDGGLGDQRVGEHPGVLRWTRAAP